MRPADLEALEFSRLLEGVACHASSSAGREACLALVPSTDLGAVRTALGKVAETLRATEDEAPPLGDFPDIRPLLSVARTAGACLGGAELRQVALALSAIRQMRGFLRAKTAAESLLQPLVASLHALPELDRSLAKALDEEGTLRDDASPTLRALRRELRELRAQIEARLARLLRRSSTSTAQIFPEDYVTLRNGRFVVPVRAQHASELPGIVQDRSSSGETLFIEPLFAVEANNRLLIAAREEAQEEIRILTELTGLVGEHAPALGEAFAALVEIDTLVARATFARRHGAVCPALGGTTLDLRNARHPLLLQTGRPVVPIDLDLDSETRLLVITGPNTGGKSVALKTLGLLVLMAQSGIPVPAGAGASLPLFDAVWTDIGDPQNVAGDLSTFSGHVRNVAEILRECTNSSLVLLDEPGTGTDPEDGAALAHVLLHELVARGAWVLATTHFQAVKMLALSTQGAKVAGVDFTPETFAPLYRLLYGSVGPSLGLTMARRLGFPEDLLRAAEHERSDLSTRFGEAVERLEAERRRFEAAHEQIESEREELRRLRAEHAELTAELRDKQQKRWAEELSEAKQFTDELRREGRRLLAEARQRPEVARQLDSLAREQDAAIETRRSAILSPEEKPAEPQALSIGDEVMVMGSQLSGTLLRLAGDRAQISRGAVRFDVPAKQLRRLEGGGRASSVSPPRVPLVRALKEPAPGERPTEINLIGSRVPVALERLESFLDRASVDELPSVRIVHGHGTGALRGAIHEFLAGSPYVARFEDAGPRAGGSGATIAHLR